MFKIHTVSYSTTLTLFCTVSVQDIRYISSYVLKCHYKQTIRFSWQNTEMPDVHNSLHTQCMYIYLIHMYFLKCKFGVN